MKIFETQLAGKQGKIETCEDEIFISEDYIAVIDGVTSKGKHLWGGMTSAKKAAQTVKESLANAEPNFTAEEMLTFLSKQLNAQYYSHIEEYDILELLRACIIIYSVKHQQIWSYGDCQCMINGTVHKHDKRIDELTSQMRSFLSEYYLKNGYTLEELRMHDLGRQAIIPYLEKQFSFENEESYWGYPVLNGMTVNCRMIVKYQLKKGDEVVLASDGFPELAATLQESEKRLKEILQEDPMGIARNMTTKGIKTENVSFDDRAYIRFLI